MDLPGLQIFVEVMRQGSFAAVARDRNVDPSSVSRAIASLEKKLGVRLFQRTTRQLSPTEAGTTFFEWIFRDSTGITTTIPIRGRTIISNAIALEQCAIAGMGLALLPNWLMIKDLKAGTLVNLFPNHEVTATDFRTAAWLVYPSRTYVPLKVRAFIEFLKASIPTLVTAEQLG